MDEAKLYYTPPPQECFNEVKYQAMNLWSTMGDEPSYAEEKIGRIKDIENISDNFMYMVAMFDMGNQGILASKLSEQTRDEIRNRMIAGGSPLEYIVF